MIIIYREEKWELKGGMTARDAIRKVGLDPEAILVIRNGELHTDDVILRDDDTVRLISVISGG